jgi:hypothetical protein
MCRFTKDPPAVLLEWSQFAPVLILLVAFVTAYYALTLPLALSQGMLRLSVF